MKTQKIIPCLWFVAEAGHIKQVTEYYEKVFGKNFSIESVTPLGETPGGNIFPALPGSQLQRSVFRHLQALTLLDQPQPVAQHLAGILVATRLHQGLDQLVLVVAQHHVARRHSTTSRLGCGVM